MKYTPIVLVTWLSCALPVAAQTLSPPEVDVLPRLLDVACLDLIEESNGCEQVILLASEIDDTTADLIVLRDWRTDPASEPLLVARAIAFNGPMWGMAPRIAQADNGSLLLHSEQTGIGRHPWYQTLTLAWRAEQFVVAGFTYASYDRLSGGGMTCDVNLLTGDYVAEARSVNPDTEVETVLMDDRGRLEGRSIAAVDWAVTNFFPEPCSAAMDTVDSP